MYTIEFSESAKKQLDKLEINLRKRIVHALERIKIRPHHFIKRKQGTPHFIFRIGNYRAILRIENNRLLIFVIEIGLRKNIYQK